MIKGDLRKASLLDTAERLFFTRGYAATTINDILETQHCSKGSFYHHFESKLDVLTALCRAHAAQAQERYEQTLSEQDTALERLNLLLESSFPVNRREEKLCSLLMQLIATPEGEQVLFVFFEELRRCFFEECKALIEQLSKEEQAFLPIEGLPELVFNAYQAQCRMILLAGSEMSADSSGVPEERALQTLRSIRYLFERVLDLPFGSIRIADSGELVQVLSGCARQVRSFRPPEEPVKKPDQAQMSLL